MIATAALVAQSRVCSKSRAILKQNKGIVCRILSRKKDTNILQKSTRVPGFSQKGSRSYTVIINLFNLKTPSESVSNMHENVFT